MLVCQRFMPFELPYCTYLNMTVQVGEGMHYLIVLFWLAYSGAELPNPGPSHATEQRVVLGQWGLWIRAEAGFTPSR